MYKQQISTVRLRGHERGCIAIVGYEGTEEHVARARPRAGDILREHGGLSLGARPGRSWLKNRYAAPYLRDGLLDRGVMVETLETATVWSGYMDGAVRSGDSAAEAVASTFVAHSGRFATA